MTLQQKLDNILEQSEFLNIISQLKTHNGKSVLFGNAIRPLSQQEIDHLIKNGNRCSNWHDILVANDFSPLYISGSVFMGHCVLGVFTGKPCKVASTLTLPSGIYGTIVSNSEIGSESLIDISSISNYIVMENVTMYHVGSLSCSLSCSFGNGNDIVCGIETGGRNIQSFADMTIAIAEAVTMDRANMANQRAFDSFVQTYTGKTTLTYGVVCQNSVLLQSHNIHDSFIGPGAVVNGATLVQNSTLLCTMAEPAEVSHGAYVKDSCIQWGCNVSSLAIVDNAILCEHSHVERHGKVTQSIIGSNTGVAEGEITSCLVGPFTGFHHQALLIAASWPQGKGNVGYGANVGSNHTSKAPDQEIICGEGLFFGLGSTIKFPADFSQAPYTIIATGVTTLPQRMTFPFSLINSPSQSIPGISPAINEIVPAWVLSDNIYAIKRNEAKFFSRNKAKRSTIDVAVFKPAIIDMMIAARNVLSSISTTKDVYLEKDIKGLGKNFLTENNRKKAIATYNFYLEHYCLTGFVTQVKNLISDKKAITVLYTQSSSDSTWEHQRELLTSEGFTKRSVRENLNQYLAMSKTIAQDTEKAKAKDDKRGMAIISDYKEAHVLSKDDAFVKSTWEKLKEEEDIVKNILDNLT